MSPWDLFMLGISLLVLVSLALEMLLPMEAETLRLLNRIDTVMCGFFLVDFGVRLVRAKDRLE